MVKSDNAYTTYATHKNILRLPKHIVIPNEYYNLVLRINARL